MPPTSFEDAEGLRLPNGKPVITAYDVSQYLGVPLGKLAYALYKAPDDKRYVPFEIPKRTGGMRQIYSPNGLIRDLQTKLAPVLQATYVAHPAAHGFIKERSIVSNAKLHVGQRYVL